MELGDGHTWQCHFIFETLYYDVIKALNQLYNKQYEYIYIINTNWLNKIKLDKYIDICNKQYEHSKKYKTNSLSDVLQLADWLRIVLLQCITNCIFDSAYQHLCRGEHTCKSIFCYTNYINDIGIQIYIWVWGCIYLYKYTL